MREFYTVRATANFQSADLSSRLIDVMSALGESIKPQYDLSPDYPYPLGVLETLVLIQVWERGIVLLSGQGTVMVEEVDRLVGLGCEVAQALMAS